MSKESFEYAKALFGLAKNKDEKKEFLNDLNSSVEAFDHDIMNFFTHPEISKDSKKEIIIKSYPSGYYRDFLCVLIDNNRISMIEEIKDDFEKLYLEENKVTQVTVYSKVELDDDYLNEIKNKMEKKIGNDVEVTNLIDTNIIGGIRIEYDSNLIDLTINHKFGDMVAKLKE